MGAPFDDSYVSLVLPATDTDGAAVVLKIQFPDRETEFEATTLQRWGGAGAVQLLATDSERHALLIERCVPGAPLAGAGPDRALAVLIGLLPRLWVPAGKPFRSLAEEASWWASDLEENWERAGRPFERALIHASLDTIEALSASQGEQVLLHQDLHAGNVLSAEREPWLVIDPKPLAGEREFAIAPIVRGAELGHGREHVLSRLDRLTAELGLDRDRAAGWAFAQTVAWAFEGGRALPRHVETARWLLP